MKLTYRHTLLAGFTGYIVQAIIVNFVPLLFLTFMGSYGISLSKITLLITFNFGVQLLTDLLAVAFVDRIGYKTSFVSAHILAFLGLAGLTVLPGLFSDPFHGLVIAVIIYAIGGGLLEVLVSPIVEACPTRNKEMIMSILHSFYCWGHVGVVLISALFFFIFGIDRWPILAIFWSTIPLLNAFLFAQVPIRHLIKDNERAFTLKELLTENLFWVMILMMVASGAAEQSVSQWISTFAEDGLGLSKLLGDMAGPMMFAIMMGTSRVFYAKFSTKIKLEKFMVYSAFLCLASYLMISLSPWPLLSLIGSGICGLSVGIMWPGSFSISSKKLPHGGTKMFALLALAGDLGCVLGPTLVGEASALSGNMRKGLMLGIIFPAIFLFAIYISRRTRIKTRLNFDT